MTEETKQAQTTAYTFKVTMIVEVYSRDGEEQALANLDERGGYITDRQVELLNAIPIPRVDGVTNNDAEKPKVRKMNISDFPMTK